MNRDARDASVEQPVAGAAGRLRVIALWTFLATLAAVWPAAAQPASSGPAAANDPEALVVEGVRLRRAGNDVGAIYYFERAYAMARSPRMAGLLGLCEMALARFVEAEVHLAEALRSTDDRWVNENRASLFGAISEVKNFLGSLEIVGRPAGAEVEVDGRTIGRLPLAAPLRVLSGRDLFLRVAAPGHEPLRRSVKVEPRELTRLVIELDPYSLRTGPPAPLVSPLPAAPDGTGGPALAPPSAGPPPPGWPHAGPPSPGLAGSHPPPALESSAGTWRKPAGWASAGAAIGLGAAGAFFLARSNGKVDEFNRVEDAPNPSGRCNKNLPFSGGAPCRSLLDQADRAQALAIVGFAGAGVAAAMAVIFFATAGGEEAPRTALACAPAGVSSVACGWRF